MYITNNADFDYVSSPIRVKPSLPHCENPLGSRSLKKSQNLFHEGDDAYSVFEVVSGVLRVSKILEDGRRLVIAFGYPGDIVGFPQGGMYHTECDAITPSEVVLHNIKHLENSEHDPDLHLRLVKAAMKELSAMQDHFMMLGRKTAHEKIASFLNVLMDRVGKPLGAYTQIEFPMTRSDIGDFLGITIETASRLISSLKASGIIELESARSIIVLKPDALRAMAEADF